MKNTNLKGKYRRIIGQFSWPIYLLTVALLGALTLLPVLAAGGSRIITQTGHQYILWYVLYWCIAALIFTLITAWQKYQSFDLPMQILSEAAEKVTGGDFSVRIEPLHTEPRRNEIDQMFCDFNKMTEELSSLNMMKKDFISNVSHEFKTPLSVIVNYAVSAG